MKKQVQTLWSVVPPVRVELDDFNNIKDPFEERKDEKEFLKTVICFAATSSGSLRWTASNCKMDMKGTDQWQQLSVCCPNLCCVLCREPVDEVLQMPPSLLTCGGCQQSIGDRFFLKAIEQYWHEDCLSCDLCGCRLGEVGRRLYYKLGRKLCRRDYLRFVYHV